MTLLRLSTAHCGGHFSLIYVPYHCPMKSLWKGMVSFRKDQLWMISLFIHIFDLFVPLCNHETSLYLCIHLSVLTNCLFILLHVQLCNLCQTNSYGKSSELLFYPTPMPIERLTQVLKLSINGASECVKKEKLKQKTTQSKDNKTTYCVLALKHLFTDCPRWARPR